ncbi:hypothetical protein CCP2SC5_150029 [Azospirillaceae bacterium]
MDWLVEAAGNIDIFFGQALMGAPLKLLAFVRDGLNKN